MGISHDVEKWKGSTLSYHTVFLPKKPRRAPPNVKGGHTNQRFGSDVSVANTTRGKCETWEVHTVPGIGGAGPSMSGQVSIRVEGETRGLAKPRCERTQWQGGLLAIFHLKLLCCFWDVDDGRCCGIFVIGSFVQK